MGSVLEIRRGGGGSERRRGEVEDSTKESRRKNFVPCRKNKIRGKEGEEMNVTNLFIEVEPLLLFVPSLCCFLRLLKDGCYAVLS